LPRSWEFTEIRFTDGKSSAERRFFLRRGVDLGREMRWRDYVGKLGRVKEERDILKKAVAYFTKEFKRSTQNPGLLTTGF